MIALHFRLMIDDANVEIEERIGVTGEKYEHKQRWKQSSRR